MTQRHGRRQRLGRREQTLSDARGARRRRRRVGDGGVGDGRRRARRGGARAEGSRRRRRERCFVAARARTRALPGRAHEHTHQHALRASAVAEGGVAGAERLARRRFRLGGARRDAGVERRAPEMLRDEATVGEAELVVRHERRQHARRVRGVRRGGHRVVHVHGDALHVLGGVRVRGGAGGVVRRRASQPARIGHRTRATSLDDRRPGPRGGRGRGREHDDSERERAARCADHRGVVPHRRPTRAPANARGPPETVSISRNSRPRITTFASRPRPHVIERALAKKKKTNKNQSKSFPRPTPLPTFARRGTPPASPSRPTW